jgi:DNA-damage-inducible protein D
MAEQSTQIALFEGRYIRRHWDQERESWCFSVVDILTVLSDSKNPAVYWRVLKKRLLDEGSDETVTNCNGLKMPAADGKMRLTDMADTETMLRIIQSVPSPKSEPFKRWHNHRRTNSPLLISTPSLIMPLSF